MRVVKIKSYKNYLIDILKHNLIEKSEKDKKLFVYSQLQKDKKIKRTLRKKFNKLRKSKNYVKKLLRLNI
ncbi:hypothetical protein BNATCHR360 (nucleomorph) [Bigelowiella natans]|uniref:Uncharacterized protein n=1 Tax=Bigelowiella natans TaxID=227086 RepID=Q3LW09_BIGNA|nr:hypothetical protein BNATCHR360 [Bigelowiella natans]ABA27357.1 hypothetical protein [Bigelowiella natans]